MIATRAERSAMRRTRASLVTLGLLCPIRPSPPRTTACRHADPSASRLAKSDNSSVLDAADDAPRRSSAVRRRRGWKRGGDLARNRRLGCAHNRGTGLHELRGVVLRAEGGLDALAQCVGELGGEVDLVLADQHVGSLRA